MRGLSHQVPGSKLQTYNCRTMHLKYIAASIPGTNTSSNYTTKTTPSTTTPTANKTPPTNSIPHEAEIPSFIDNTTTISGHAIALGVLVGLLLVKIGAHPRGVAGALADIVCSFVWFFVTMVNGVEISCAVIAKSLGGLA